MFFVYPWFWVISQIVEDWKKISPSACSIFCLHGCLCFSNLFAADFPCLFLSWLHTKQTKTYCSFIHSFIHLHRQRQRQQQHTSWLAMLSLADSSSFKLSSCCCRRSRCSSKDSRLISNSWLSFCSEEAGTEQGGRQKRRRRRRRKRRPSHPSKRNNRWSRRKGSKIGLQFRVSRAAAPWISFWGWAELEHGLVGRRKGESSFWTEEPQHNHQPTATPNPKTVFIIRPPQQKSSFSRCLLISLSLKFSPGCRPFTPRLHPLHIPRFMTVTKRIIVCGKGCSAGGGGCRRQTERLVFYFLKMDITHLSPVFPQLCLVCVSACLSNCVCVRVKSSSTGRPLAPAETSFFFFYNINRIHINFCIKTIETI